MARTDWNRCYYRTYPARFQESIVSYHSVVGAGKALVLSGNGQGDTRMCGYMYNNVGSMPLQDGSISCGLSIDLDAPLRTGINGTIMRLPVLPSDDTELDVNDYSYYMFGPSEHTEQASGSNINCRLVRINDSALNYLVFSYDIPVIGNTYWIQYEVQVQNNESDNVEIWVRYNDGSAITLSKPGSGPEWTDYELIYTDTNVNKITSAGYWGFGNVATANYSGGNYSKKIKWDSVQIHTGV